MPRSLRFFGLARPTLLAALLSMTLIPAPAPAQSDQDKNDDRRPRQGHSQRGDADSRKADRAQPDNRNRGRASQAAPVRNSGTRRAAPAARFSPVAPSTEIRRAAPGFRPPAGAAPSVRWSLDSRHGHSHFYPGPGYQVAALPTVHRTIVYRSDPYYFYAGIWYRPATYGYVVVRPPIGILVPLLPLYYTSIWIGGTRYYYANNVYYLPVAGGYTVVETPVGMISRVEANQPAASSSGPFAEGTWYWCQASAAYYPYVNQCESGWEPIPAVPSDLRGAPEAFAQGTWYWCEESGGYYPYVGSCPSGWRQVPASAQARR
ncbi:MAG: DUF6515 family protein [Quisquiliibacterium sp.]